MIKNTVNNVVDEVLTCDLFEVSSEDDIYDIEELADMQVGETSFLDWYSAVSPSVSNEPSRLMVSKDGYILQSSLAPKVNKPIMPFHLWYATIAKQTLESDNKKETPLFLNHKQGRLVHASVAERYIEDTFNDCIDNFSSCGVCDFTPTIYTMSYGSSFSLEEAELFFSDAKGAMNEDSILYKYGNPLISNEEVLALYTTHELTSFFSVNVVDCFHSYIDGESRSFVGMIIAGSELVRGHKKVKPFLTFQEWMNKDKDFPLLFNKYLLEVHSFSQRTPDGKSEYLEKDRIIMLAPNDVIFVHPFLYNDYINTVYGDMIKSMNEQDKDDNTNTGLSELSFF